MFWNRAQQTGLLHLRMRTLPHVQRFFSAANTKMNANPSYQVYGETAALTVKMLPPSFKQYGKSMIVLDGSKKGRLLLEFAPRKTGNESGRYAWDRSVKIAITAEEAGMLLGRLHTLEGIDVYRQQAVNAPHKVLRVQEFPDGSALFLVDHYLDGVGGQKPSSPEEAQGPIEVSLMVGEYQVIRSIFEYSIPRLIGWSTMMDATMENALTHQSAPVPSPHNYSPSGRATDLPF